MKKNIFLNTACYFRRISSALAMLVFFSSIFMYAPSELHPIELHSIELRHDLTSLKPHEQAEKLNEYAKEVRKQQQQAQMFQTWDAFYQHRLFDETVKKNWNTNFNKALPAISADALPMLVPALIREVSPENLTKRINDITDSVKLKKELAKAYVDFAINLAGRRKEILKFRKEEREALKNINEFRLKLVDRSYPATLAEDLGTAAVAEITSAQSVRKMRETFDTLTPFLRLEDIDKLLTQINKQSATQPALNEVIQAVENKRHTIVTESAKLPRGTWHQEAQAALKRIETTDDLIAYLPLFVSKGTDASKKAEKQKAEDLFFDIKTAFAHKKIDLSKADQNKLDTAYNQLLINTLDPKSSKDLLPGLLQYATEFVLNQEEIGKKLDVQTAASVLAEVDAPDFMRREGKESDSWANWRVQKATASKKTLTDFFAKQYAQKKVGELRAIFTQPGTAAKKLNRSTPLLNKLAAFEFDKTKPLSQFMQFERAQLLLEELAKLSSDKNWQDAIKGAGDAEKTHFEAIAKAQLALIESAAEAFKNLAAGKTQLIRDAVGKFWKNVDSENQKTFIEAISQRINIRINDIIGSTDLSFSRLLLHALEFLLSIFKGTPGADIKNLEAKKLETELARVQEPQEKGYLQQAFGLFTQSDGPVKDKSGPVEVW